MIKNLKISSELPFSSGSQPTTSRSVTFPEYLRKPRLWHLLGYWGVKWWSEQVAGELVNERWGVQLVNERWGVCVCVWRSYRISQKRGNAVRQEAAVIWNADALGQEMLPCGESWQALSCLSDGLYSTTLRQRKHSNGQTVH